jgi:hypothetical protein
MAWRFQNYGLMPTLKYAFNKLAKGNYWKIEVQTLEIFEFLDLFGIPIAKKNQYIESAIKNIKSLLLTLTENQKIVIGAESIKDVYSERSSITRLLLLSLIIKTQAIDSIIETGTQHGVSAFMIREFIQDQPRTVFFRSYDVKKDILLSRDIEENLVILKTPIREDFCKQTLITRNGNLLFFHDSDHSEENMLFELDWAWNNLFANFVLCDDIDGNNAFAIFCELNKLIGYRIKFDSGPAVGFVQRNLED